jgi:hypothetical protein
VKPRIQMAGNTTLKKKNQLLSRNNVSFDNNKMEEVKINYAIYQNYFINVTKKSTVGKLLKQS